MTVLEKVLASRLCQALEQVGQVMVVSVGVTDEQDVLGLGDLEKAGEGQSQAMKCLTLHVFERVMQHELNDMRDFEVC